jgi:hypothetical protein
VAVIVWNQGEYNGLAQHSYRTAFIVQGHSPAEALINTDARWKVLKDSAYHPVVFKPSDPRLFWQYYVAGALDSLQGALYPWGWEKPGYSDVTWDQAKTLGNGTPDGPENATHWTLYPRPMAYLERISCRFAAVRSSSGVNAPSGAEGDAGVGATPMTIPANTHAELLLDTKDEATAYPRLSFSGGQHSRVKISYAETLLDIEKDNPYKWHKTDRDAIEGKKLVGVYDIFEPDGGRDRVFIPLWMRTFRYVKVEISTLDAPLTINDISYDLTVYPFKNAAAFSTNDSLHRTIFDACWRTIRLASQETYIDPYFEQMQYIGDTRIQALYAYYHFTDDRLSINAIRQFDWSRSTEGITMSRYPSDLPQYTPLYALCWMLMVKDYWMLRRDETFTRQYIPAMLHVLDWFDHKVNSEGMLGDLPYLDFFDSNYPRDKILRASTSKSLTPYSLFYVYAVQQMRPFFDHFGKAADLAPHVKVANAIRGSVVRTCFSPGRGLFADNPEKHFFSQHANILAVLTGCLPAGAEKAVMRKVLADTSLIHVALYFEFYEFEALRHAGMADTILQELGDWKTMLADHRRTFSEVLNDPRSECHAWSAYPAYFFLNTIAGIEPATPGFATVKIEPHPGSLTKLSAQMPHPDGVITTDYEKGGNGSWNIRIGLPANLNGTFTWKKQSLPLHGGINSFSLR